MPISAEQNIQSLLLESFKTAFVVNVNYDSYSFVQVERCSETQNDLHVYAAFCSRRIVKYPVTPYHLIKAYKS